MKKKFTITILGEQCVGKTSISLIYQEKRFNIQPFFHCSILDSYQKVKFPDDDNKYTFKIFDCPGQERYRSIANSTIQIADGFLMIFSVYNMETFRKIVNWIKFINKSVDFKQKVVFLIGNKADKDERVVKKEEAEEYAKKMDIKYRETSVKTGEGINEVFQEIFNDIYKNYKYGLIKYGLISKNKKNNLNLKLLYSNLEDKLNILNKFISY